MAWVVRSPGQWMRVMLRDSRPASRAGAIPLGRLLDCPGALRPWPGGWPLPAAGGRRHHCGRHPTKPRLLQSFRRQSETDSVSSASLQLLPKPVAAIAATESCSYNRKSSGFARDFRVISLPTTILRSDVSMGSRRQPCDPITSDLLNFYFCSGVFQLLLGGFGVGLRDAFLHGLRRAVDQVLRFLQTQAGQLAHRLDDVHLVVADRSENDGELRLLFGGSGRRGTRGGRCDRDSGGSGDAELVFHRLDELRELQDGHRRDLVEDFSLYCGHVCS